MWMCKKKKKKKFTDYKCNSLESHLEVPLSLCSPCQHPLFLAPAFPRHCLLPQRAVTQTIGLTFAATERIGTSGEREKE